MGAVHGRAARRLCHSEAAGGLPLLLAVPRRPPHQPGLEVTHVHKTMAYIPPSRRGNAADGGALRDARSILNKLTREKFELLSKKMLDIKIHSVLLLKKLIDCVFDKALLEPNFGDLYAELCKKVSERDSPWPFIEIANDPEKGGWCWNARRSARSGKEGVSKCPGSLEDEICCGPHGPYRSQEDASKSAMSRAGFKRFLLNKCQEEFEKEARHRALITVFI